MEIKKIKRIIRTFCSKLCEKRKKSHSLIFLAVLVLIGLAYSFRGQFVVATVNGQPITRLALIQELEGQAGKRALESIITKTLIFQEAKKQNVRVSAEEVDQEIKNIEENFTSQGQDLDQVLGAQGIDRDGLGEEIKIQKIVERIVGKDISVTEEEINDYIEKNKDFIPEDSDSEEIKAYVKQQLEQQKMDEKIQSWLESLHNEAKVNHLLKF